MGEMTSSDCGYELRVNFLQLSYDVPSIAAVPKARSFVMTHKKGTPMAQAAYSPLFCVLHDELGPIGSLGRGTHSSILSAVQWRNAENRPMAVPKIQRFALIWDEDHDTRVIPVLEAAYMNNLLAPVLYIGERKASLTVIVDDAFPMSSMASFEESWSGIMDKALVNDHWGLDIARIGDLDKEGVYSQQIIHDKRERVRTYLSNLYNLWHLGLHPYSHPKLAESID